tara:strand:- start:47 stop:178 length:132 start_codon:yes stop_codon:yes gene_type:complete
VNIQFKNRNGKPIMAFKLVDKKIDDAIFQAQLKRNRKLKKLFK